MKTEKPVVRQRPLATLARVWGVERVIACGPGYVAKILMMRAGTRGNLQLHRQKHETEYVYRGVIKVEYDDGSGKLVRKKLNPGMSVQIPPGVTHRVSAVTDAVIFEGSTRHFNDRVRMEQVYGEPITPGLPTTDKPSVEISG